MLEGKMVVDRSRELSNQDFDLPEPWTKLYGLAIKLARSSLIPKRYIGKPEDIMVALEYGNTVGLTSPLVALSELSVINGSPAVSAKMGIALANSSGIFKDRINFRSEGETWQEIRVWATATRAIDSKVVEAEASIRMAIAEGWTSRRDSTKYKSMPIQMLSYRAATALIKKHAPEVLLGIKVLDIDPIESSFPTRGIAKINENIQEASSSEGLNL